VGVRACTLNEACQERKAWLRKTDLPYGVGTSMLKKKKTHGKRTASSSFFTTPPLRSREVVRDALTEKRWLEPAHGREAIDFGTRRQSGLNHLPCHRSRLSTSFVVVPGFRSPSLPRIYRPVHELAYHKSLTKCSVYTQTSLSSPICADGLRDSSQVTTGWLGYSQF
jgi:hypothetical protein